MTDNLAPAAPVITVRGLRFLYSGSSEDVLRVPFLDVPPTGMTAITGPSGAGKSTLIELLAGTLREPYEGSVQVLGIEWQSLARDADRQRQLRRIGLIPQDYGLLTYAPPPNCSHKTSPTAELPGINAPPAPRAHSVRWAWGPTRAGPSQGFPAVSGSGLRSPGCSPGRWNASSLTSRPPTLILP